MPTADLKKDNVLVRFRWSYHRDRVHVHGFFGEPVNPDEPAKAEKLKKCVAQARWKQLIRRGYKLCK